MFCDLSYVSCSFLYHKYDFAESARATQMSTAYMQEKVSLLSTSPTYIFFIYILAVIFLLFEYGGSVLVYQSKNIVKFNGRQIQPVFLDYLFICTCDLTSSDIAGLCFEQLDMLMHKCILFCDDQAMADILQEKVDALSFTKRKTRLRPTLSIEDPSLTQPPATQSIVASQFVTPSLLEDNGTQGAKAAGMLF